jgi:hypothetical protein
MQEEKIDLVHTTPPKNHNSDNKTKKPPQTSHNKQTKQNKQRNQPTKIHASKCLTQLLNPTSVCMHACLLGWISPRYFASFLLKISSGYHGAILGYLIT